MPGRHKLDAVRSAIRAGAVPSAEHEKAQYQPPPTVTISREAGIDATPVTDRLVQLLAERDGGSWMVYDKNLIEHVAEDHDLSEQLVKTFAERDRNWLTHFAAHLPGASPTVDVARRVAQSIRGLAKIGRTVIVGRGGQAILGGLPNVVHVRLVAPMEWRIEQYVAAEDVGGDKDKAADAIRTLDADRLRWVKNHFHVDLTDLGLYDAVLNVARLDPDRAATAIANLTPPAN
jgi:cytidylate kinase